MHELLFAAFITLTFALGASTVGVCVAPAKGADGKPVRQVIVFLFVLNILLWLLVFSLLKA